MGLGPHNSIRKTKTDTLIRQQAVWSHPGLRFPHVEDDWGPIAEQFFLGEAVCAVRSDSLGPM